MGCFAWYTVLPNGLKPSFREPDLRHGCRDCPECSLQISSSQIELSCRTCSWSTQRGPRPALRLSKRDPSLSFLSSESSIEEWSETSTAARSRGCFQVCRPHLSISATRSSAPPSS